MEKEKEKEGIMRREYYSKGTMPARNKKNFRPTTKSGAGMTEAGVKAYRRLKSWFKIKNSRDW